jgi:hypothetical protein
LGQNPVSVNLRRQLKGMPALPTRGLLNPGPFR